MSSLFRPDHAKTISFLAVHTEGETEVVLTLGLLLPCFSSLAVSCAHPAAQQLTATNLTAAAVHYAGSLTYVRMIISLKADTLR